MWKQHPYETVALVLILALAFWPFLKLVFHVVRSLITGKPIPPAKNSFGGTTQLSDPPGDEQNDNAQ